MMNWEPLLFRVFRIGKPEMRADERTRTAFLLITSEKKGAHSYAPTCRILFR
jgi:hypothetical protein